MANEITYKLTTIDGSTPTVDKVLQSYERLDNQIKQNQRTLGAAVPSAQAWERQIDRLTTANGLAYEAVRRFNALLSGMAWGFVIGVVASMTDEIIKQAKAWAGAETALDKYHDKIRKARETEALLALRAAKDEAQTKLADANRAVRDLYGVGTFQQLDRAQSYVRRLQSDINDINKQIDVIKNQKQAEAPKIPKPPKTQEDTFGVDPFRGMNARFRREESNDIALADRQDHDQREAAAREHAETMRAIAVSNQAQITNIDKMGSDYREQIRQIDLQREQNKAYAVQFILGSLMAFQNSNSRAMFRVAQVAAIADATVHTYMAANKALASAPPPWNYALASAVVAAGLANVAQISSTQFGGGSRGGGGGSGPSGGSTTPSSGQASAPGNSEVRHVLEIRLSNEGVVTDMLANALVDPIMRNLGERSGNAGNYRVEITRH